MSDMSAVPGVQRAEQSQLRDGSWAATTLRLGWSAEAILEQIRVLVGSGWVEEIEVRDEDRADLLNWIVAGARLAGRRVRLVAEISPEHVPTAQAGEHWRMENGAWMMLPPQQPRLLIAMKRLIDLIVASTLLVLLAPIFIALAIAVKLTSEGPVFYRWRVLGRNGRPFVGYKFRTMVANADELKLGLRSLNERRGPVFKIAADPRVTPTGRWLRRHSLDELPQLWSVLVGDMSLVGPRPVFPSEYINFELWQMRKLSVRPGLTCLWQVDGRERMVEFSDWARLDLKYIDTWSLWSDLVIVLRTAFVVVKGTGS